MKKSEILEQAKIGKRVTFKLSVGFDDGKRNTRHIKAVKPNGCLKVSYAGLDNFIIEPIEVIEIFGGEDSENE